MTEIVPPLPVDAPAGADAGVFAPGVPAPLARLSAAVQALAEARTLDDVLQIADVAAAAVTYARAAKLGLEAQNHAAEVKLRAERKAGEMLAQLERGPEPGSGVPGPGRGNVSGNGHVSPYRATLDDVGATRQDANRWQDVAEMPATTFEDYIATTRDAEREITTAGALRAAAGAHVSHNSGEDEWYTPPEYIETATAVMGAIDLDPASTEAANRVVGAAQFYSDADDGLAQEWRGRVWMNPPYSQPHVGKFAAKLAYHVAAGDIPQACVLVNNATETGWFNDLIAVASAVCFPRGRVKFWAPDGRPSAPLQGQAVVYCGDRADLFCAEFGRFGWAAWL